MDSGPQNLQRGAVAPSACMSPAAQFDATFCHMPGEPNQ